MLMQTANSLQTPLGRALQRELQQQRIRMHVPAHAGTVLFKGGLTQHPSLFALDYTELPSLDVLGDPTGVLAESQALVAQVYQVAHSFYLINGASVGLMAALLACCTKQSHVLLARNVHRAVIQGLLVTGATPHWLLPDLDEHWQLWGVVSAKKLEAYLTQHPNISVFVCTHPTYDGVASDIAQLAQVCRRHQVVLIVDEAHGALWPLQPQMPQSAVATQADAVVHSLHKSAGAFTQGALLHLPQGSRLSAERIQQALNILQTTSPSYVLLANMEETLAYWHSDEGQARCSEHLERIRTFRDWSYSTLKQLTVYGYPDAGERFQYVLGAPQCNGERLGEILEESYQLSFERVTPTYSLFLLNPGLSDNAWIQFKTALQAVDRSLSPSVKLSYKTKPFALPDMACTPAEAWFSQGERVMAQHAVGRVAQEIIATCPPGIPVLMPGEWITEAHLDYLPKWIQVVQAGI